MTWNDAGFGDARLPRHVADRDPGSDADRLRDADGLVGALPRRAGVAAPVKGSARRGRELATSSESRSGSRRLLARARDRISLLGLGRRTRSRSPFALAAYLLVFLEMRPDTTGDEPHYLHRRREHRLSTADVDLTERLREPRADAEGRERLPARASTPPSTRTPASCGRSAASDCRRCSRPAVGLGGLTGARARDAADRGAPRRPAVPPASRPPIPTALPGAGLGRRRLLPPGRRLHQPDLPRACRRVAGRRRFTSDDRRRFEAGCARARVDRRRRSRLAPRALSPALGRHLLGLAVAACLQGWSRGSRGQWPQGHRPRRRVRLSSAASACSGSSGARSRCRSSSPMQSESDCSPPPFSTGTEAPISRPRTSRTEVPTVGTGTLELLVRVRSEGHPRSRRRLDPLRAGALARIRSPRVPRRPVRLARGRVHRRGRRL